MITTRFFALLFSISCYIIPTAGKEDSVKIFAVAYPVVAYILESEKNVATTYLVACPKSLPTASCPFSQPYTLIEGPKTVQWSYIASEQRLTVACALKGTTSMGCLATGRAGTSGPLTTEAYTWKGAKASTLFRSVELVTNTKSLMTQRVLPITTSTVNTKTKESTTAILPVVVTKTVVQSDSRILNVITAAATTSISVEAQGIKQVASPSASASTSDSIKRHGSVWVVGGMIMVTILATGGS